jgi:hypothetical protein
MMRASTRAAQDRQDEPGPGGQAASWRRDAPDCPLLHTRPRLDPWLRLTHEGNGTRGSFPERYGSTRKLDQWVKITNWA